MGREQHRGGCDSGVGQLVHEVGGGEAVDTRSVGCSQEGLLEGRRDGRRGDGGGRKYRVQWAGHQLRAGVQGAEDTEAVLLVAGSELMLCIEILPLEPLQPLLLPTLDLLLDDRAIRLDPQPVFVQEELPAPCLVAVLQIGARVRVPAVGQQVGPLAKVHSELLGLQQIQ